MSDEPEALARRLVEAGRADALLPILMFSF
jgi:hypothetical protein